MDFFAKSEFHEAEFGRHEAFNVQTNGRLFLLSAEIRVGRPSRIYEIEEITKKWRQLTSILQLERYSTQDPRKREQIFPPCLADAMKITELGNRWMKSRAFGSRILEVGFIGLVIILYFYITGGYDSVLNPAAVLKQIGTITEKDLAEKNTSESGVYSRVRHFKEHGIGAFLFVELGAYRTSASSFSVVGLSSKPVHVFGKPQFKCIWNPSRGSRTGATESKAKKILPDWGYGRTYTVVVLKCKFNQEVGSDGKGGNLSIEASGGPGIGKTLIPVNFLVLQEEAGRFSRVSFEPPFPYDYLIICVWKYQCTKRGINEDVRRVLEPWIQLGRVTIQDLREESLYDGYYHNQFLLVNDCLLRHKFMANWTFFFDLDEYMYIPSNKTLEIVLEEFKNYSQVLIAQTRMSKDMCIEEEDKNNHSRQWGIEKLVFRNTNRGVRRDRKYAIRAWKADATGVHLSKDVTGKTARSLGTTIQYYHYHGTIDKKGELCSQFYRLEKNGTNTWFINNSSYAYDDSMKILAASVKKYEIQQIGLQG